MVNLDVKKTIQVEIDTDVDVEVSDFYHEMSDAERKEMLEYILEDMSYNDTQELAYELIDDDNKFQTSRFDNLFDASLMKSLVRIYNNRAKLSINQIDKFVEFANKL